MEVQQELSLSEMSTAEFLAWELENEPTMFVIRSHCASGYVEVEDVVDTLDEAKMKGRSALERSPLTECGTGGIRWIEIDGPGILESIGLERTPDGDVVETGC